MGAPHRSHEYETVTFRFRRECRLSARNARKCCRPRWDVHSNCWRLVRGLDWFWVCLRRRCWLSQATPRDPLVLAGVVLAMLLLGLVATWIPAQRALSVNPLVLLREE